MSSIQEWLDSLQALLTRDDLMSALATPLAQNFDIVFLALIFVAAAIVSFSLVGTMGTRGPLKERLAGAKAPPGVGALSLRHGGNEPKFLNIFKPVAKALVPRSERQQARLRQDLIHAGYYNPSALWIYFATKIFLAVSLGVGCFFIVALTRPDTEFWKLLFVSGGGLLIGYVVPSFTVATRRSKRRKLIRNGFPDALDLLLVCVEAGLGLDAAIARVADEIDKAHPLLSAQFRMVGTELRAGQTRAEALRSFAYRAGVDEVQAFVALLIQSDELGTSLAQALRVHAFEMRAARLLRAEEKAHKMATKLAFPLMLGLLPVVVMVTIGPAIVGFLDFFLPAISGTSLPF